MDKYLCPSHPVSCIITGSSECGKPVFSTNLILNITNKFDKIYISSSSIHQDLCQNINKCFSNFILINIILNILNEVDIDIVIEEIVSNKDFGKSDIEIETCELIEELNFPREFENNGIIFLDDLNQKEMNYPRVQSMFKRSRHKQYVAMVISITYSNLTIS